MNATDAARVIENLTAELDAPLDERSSSIIESDYRALGRWYFENRSKSAGNAARAASEKILAAAEHVDELTSVPFATRIITDEFATKLAGKDAQIAELQALRESDEAIIDDVDVSIAALADLIGRPLTKENYLELRGAHVPGDVLAEVNSRVADKIAELQAEVERMNQQHILDAATINGLRLSQAGWESGKTIVELEADNAALRQQVERIKNRTDNLHIKYGRDHHKKITVGQIADKLMATKTDDEFCDVMDEEFLFGCHESTFKGPENFFACKDVRGIVWELINRILRTGADA